MIMEWVSFSASVRATIVSVGLTVKEYIFYVSLSKSIKQSHLIELYWIEKFQFSRSFVTGTMDRRRERLRWRPMIVCLRRLERKRSSSSPNDTNWSTDSCGRMINEEIEYFAPFCSDLDAETHFACCLRTSQKTLQVRAVLHFPRTRLVQTMELGWTEVTTMDCVLFRVGITEPPWKTLRKAPARCLCRDSRVHSLVSLSAFYLEKCLCFSQTKRICTRSIKNQRDTSWRKKRTRGAEVSTSLNRNLLFHLFRFPLGRDCCSRESKCCRRPLFQ